MHQIPRSCSSPYLQLYPPCLGCSYDVVVDVAPDLVWKTPRAYAGLEVTVEIDEEDTIAHDADANFRGRHKDLGSLKIKQGGGIDQGNVALIDVAAKRLDADGNTGEEILSATQKGNAPRTHPHHLKNVRQALTAKAGPVDAMFSLVYFAP